jgi:5-methylcytosine-specific restriction endonuclease McrA
MRLFVQVFDRCCAYCDQPIEGQPDPDHVIPLSRGGRNDISNVVPVCRHCNVDKCDLTMDEWRLERERRALQPVRYDLTSDPRFRHLSLTEPTGPAWRHREDIVA